MRLMMNAAVICRAARKISAGRARASDAPEDKPDKPDQKQKAAENCDKENEYGDSHKFFTKSKLPAACGRRVIDSFQIHCQVENADDEQNQNYGDQRKPFVRRVFGFFPDDFDGFSLKTFGFAAQVGG